MAPEPVVFLNLPVTDLKASEAFYEVLGLKKNTTWCSEDTSCMVLSKHIALMIMEPPRFKSFMPASKTLISGRSDTECLFCVTVASREDVNRTVEEAEKKGGKKDPTTLPEMGGGYGRSVEDPDGHVWEIVYMPEIGEAGLPQ